MTSSVLNDLVMLRPHGDSGRSLTSAPRFGADIRLDEIPSTNEAKKMLAAEINQISVQERNEILEAMHGVADTFDEDYETITLMIREMRSCLDRMVDECYRSGCAEHAAAYKMALAKDPEHLLSRKNLLMFLRGAKYDPEAAAVKLLSHHTEKLLLFGAGLLTKDLDLSDMEDSDVEIMESGCIFVPNYRDRTGRIIVIVQPHKLPLHATSTSLKRAYWCMIMTALRDPLTQFHGVVCVMLHGGSDQYALMKQMKLFEGADQFIPYRCHGVHYCMEESSCLAIVPLVQYFMTYTCRTRFRSHVASMEEHYKRLSSFGIVLTSFKLPELVERTMIEESGVAFLRRLTLQHRRRLMLKQAENNNPSTPKKKNTGNEISNTNNTADSSKMITVLTDNDVLWGRGKSKNYVGNVRLQKIVEEMRPRYSKSNRHEKTLIVAEVMQKVHDAGGRFLRQANDEPTSFSGEGGTAQIGGWVVQTESLSREKIGRFFRN